MKKETLKIKKEKVTIDDLAIMVAKGFGEVGGKFDEVNKKIDREIGEVKKSIAEVKENLAATRGDILGMGDRYVPRYEFYDLLIRFDKLEQKVGK